MRGVGEFGWVDQHRPSDPPTFGGRDGAGVRGSLEHVDAFHLPEQREQHQRQLGHRVGRVAGVDLDRAGEVTDPDAAFGEVVDQVEGVSDGAAETVQGVHHDHVAVPGVLERSLQPGPVGRRPAYDQERRGEQLIEVEQSALASPSTPQPRSTT